jgi:hypothetical protein
MIINYAQINLRDQIRKGETIPLQFTYEAANCRIFYTPQTFYNYTALWKYAADAIWSNSTKFCVKNSTGFATTNGSDTAGPPVHLLSPSAAAPPPPPAKLGSVIMSILDGPTAEQTTLHDSVGSSHKKSKLGSPCSDKTNPCYPSHDWYCYPKYVSGCDKKGKPIFTSGCVHTCFPVGDYCTNHNNCAPFANSTKSKSVLKHQFGFCPPAPAPCQKSTSSGIPGKYQGGGGV